MERKGGAWPGLGAGMNGVDTDTMKVTAEGPAWSHWASIRLRCEEMSLEGRRR